MILEEIVNLKKEEVGKKKELKSYNELLNVNAVYRGNFKNSLNKGKVAIIGEIKRASPSKGIIKEEFDLVEIAKTYEKAEVDAISVLTEKRFFKGEDGYIPQVKKVTTKPVLRKDFVIDEYQIYESKFLGADAVLLIVAILKDKLKNFCDIAKQIGLDVLVEVHEEEELETALKAGCDIIGINNRDLKTFEVDIKTTERLIKNIPKDKIVVSESGIKTPEEVLYLSSLGVKAVLIGESFMKMDEGRIKEFVKKVRGG
ncbi:indole-3-glycerol phosphate synthase TrpC [Caldanaerobacter sp.]|uniref:indole-3-glycerol phosphate synthase TrpC n=1 Tax=Caldanaerobacter sp. TaxID=2930036 RepID=UPI003C785E74